MNNKSYRQEFNYKALDDIKKIYDKIQEEKEQEIPDKEKILKLKQAQLLKGMEINSGFYYNNCRRNIPW